jgi:zinc/manganese transport system permease protein
MPIIELLWPAFILIILLVFIHAIFGLEIIKRGVIFTDLAIGQIAAVGMAISIGFFEGDYQLLLTLTFALLGALLITYATRKLEHIEAFIGMLYALGASTIMILLASSPQGAELFQKLSATDILFTSPEEIYPSAILYVGIALVMFTFYPRTTGLTRELTFFSMLALTVTSSVQLAGVLVVFVLLVAPAFIALSQKRFRPLYLAWGSGLLLSFIALVTSYHFDLPTGYSIIFFQSIAVVLFSFFVAKRS